MNISTGQSDVSLIFCHVGDVLRDDRFTTGVLWARPQSWIGTGGAITMSLDGGLNYVPTSRGGIPWHPHGDDLTDDWQLITPDAVLRERTPGE